MLLKYLYMSTQKFHGNLHYAFVLHILDWLDGRFKQDVQSVDLVFIQGTSFSRVTCQ
jgi:hypothetical protein